VDDHRGQSRDSRGHQQAVQPAHRGPRPREGIYITSDEPNVGLGRRTKAVSGALMICTPLYLIILMLCLETARNND